MIATILATHDASVSVWALVVGLLVTAVVALFVYVAVRAARPAWAGACAAAIVVIGALLTLLWAL